MAFPTVVTRATSGEAVNTTTHTVTLPSGIVSGDLIIVVYAQDGVPSSLTWPSGAGLFTEFFNVSSGIAMTLAMAWRKADGTEGSTIDITVGFGQQSAHASYRISGHVDPTTQPPEVSTGASGTDDSPDPDSLTPTGGSKDYLWLAMSGHDNGSITTNSIPTNYTDSLLVEAGSGGGAGVGCAERDLAASAENPGAFTLSGSEDWVACMVAVHPGAVVVSRRSLLFY